MLVLGLVLVVVAAVAMPMAVFAATTDIQTTTVGGTVLPVIPPSITVQPPCPVSFGNFVITGDGVNYACTTLGLQQNCLGTVTAVLGTLSDEGIAPLTWKVDALATWNNMYSPSTDTWLVKPLWMAKDNGGAYPTQSWVLAAPGMTVASGIADYAGNLPVIDFAQQVLTTDAAGAYYDTMTFTGSIVP